MLSQSFLKNMCFSFLHYAHFFLCMEELYQVLGAARQLQDSEDVDPAAEFRKYRCCEISRMQQWVFRNNDVDLPYVNPSSCGSSVGISAPMSFTVAECAGCGLTYTVSVGSSRLLKHYHMGRLPLKDRPWDTEEECEIWAKHQIESHRDLLNENVIKLSNTLMMQ